MDARWERAAEVMRDFMSHPVTLLLKTPDPARGGASSATVAPPPDLEKILDLIRTRQYATLAEWQHDVETLWTRYEQIHRKRANRCAMKHLRMIFAGLVTRSGLGSLDDWFVDVTRLQDRLNKVLRLLPGPPHVVPAPPPDKWAQCGDVTQEELRELAREVKKLTEAEMREFAVIVARNKEIHPGWAAGMTLEHSTLQEKTIRELQALVARHSHEY
jgi:hypothetical protein